MSNPTRITFPEFGPPHQVVRPEAFSPRQPGPGEALVRIDAAPVNPADLNFIEGTYGIKPDLPATAGLEGTGLVESIGPDVASLQPGNRVLFLSSPGTWATHATCSADDLLVLPSEIDPVQAAMLKVNPMTALRMIEDFVTLKPGDWLMQNAANSGVGQYVIQLAAAKGIKTVNLVRDTACAPTLEKLGADLILADDDSARDHLPGNCKPALALNAVGGDSATRVMGMLAPDATLVTYGAMSRKALKVPNSFLLFRNLSLQGFWLTRWTRQTSREQIREAYQPLAQLMAQGRLSSTVAATYPLDQAAAAVEHAARGSRGGKITLSCA